MLKLAILCICVGATAGILGIGSVQSVAVKGKLTCNGKPAAQVKLKLVEKEPVWDTDLKVGATNDDGTFSLQGNKTEWTDIDPKLNVYHKCNYQGKCFRKFKINIPDNFITHGSATPDKVFDIGELNLAASFSGESTDCFN